MQYRQLCAQKLALRKKKKRDNSYSSKNQSPFVVFAPAPCVNVPPPPMQVQIAHVMSPEEEDRRQHRREGGSPHTPWSGLWTDHCKGRSPQGQGQKNYKHFGKRKRELSILELRWEQGAVLSSTDWAQSFTNTE